MMPAPKTSASQNFSRHGQDRPNSDKAPRGGEGRHDGRRRSSLWTKALCGELFFLRILVQIPVLPELQEEKKEKIDVKVTKDLKRQLRHERFLQSLSCECAMIPQSSHIQLDSRPLYSELQSSAPTKKGKGKSSSSATAMSVDEQVLSQINTPSISSNPFDTKTRGSQNLRTKKGRARLQMLEAVQLYKVLNHPSFMQDPEDTIVEHLQNTYGRAKSVE